MSGHSKQQLLERLSQASVRHGWGGVLALDQKVLNLTLREQFLEALGGLSFVEPIDLQADLDEGGQVTISFRGLVFGAPEVSFEQATFAKAELTLRLSIIAGECVREVAPVGQPRRVVESFSIGEELGYRVEARLALGTESGDSSAYASVVLDLAQMHDVSTNLAPTEYANRMLGRRLQEYIGYQAAYRRSYTLGRFDLEDYHPLSPSRIEVRTMAAPWGQSEPEPRYGDGAVLVFMQLGVDARPGGAPDPGFDFPYPIPEEASGLAGTLILDPTIDGLGAGDALEALRPLRMTNGLAFADTDRHTPCDWVLFGQWQASAQTVRIEPAFATVAAGQHQPFTLHGAPSAVQWSASNLLRPLASGSFQGSTYNSRGVADFAQDRQLVVVSATYPEGRRHALVSERARSVQVSPRVASWVAGNAPIELRAATSEGGTLSWTLAGSHQLAGGAQRHGSRANGQAYIEEPLGVLEDLGAGRARFTPANPSSFVPEIRIQQIKVTDRQSGQSAECAVVIIAWPASLAVEPYHVPQLESAQTVTFSLANSNRKVTWHVFGDGEIDADGRYTPAQKPTLPVSVIMADDGDERTGYALVEVAQDRVVSSAVMSWTRLSTFEVKVIGVPRCFANGWQQLEIEVSVAAQDGPDGQPLEISDADLASLKLMEQGSSNEIPFLKPDEEGIDPGSDLTWAVSTSKNRVDPPAGVIAEQDPATSLAQIRRRRLFVHTRQATTIEVYAAIQNSQTYQWFYSKDSGEKGRVELTGLTVPSFARPSYSFERKRVSGDVSPVEGDEFVYVDNTTDHWRLAHVVRGGAVVKFVRLRIASQANKSTIRWASQQYEDHYCSYTGFAFSRADGKEADEGLLFDGLLFRMASHREHSLPSLEGENVAPGELLISLHRRSGFKFWDDIQTGEPYRASLERPLELELIDQEGNLHRLRLSFGIDEADGRNGLTVRDKLQLSLR